MRIALRLLASIVLAGAAPWLQLQVACRDRFSEACVWGKAYLPVSTAISIVVFTPVAFFVLFGLERLIRRR